MEAKRISTGLLAILLIISLASCNSGKPNGTYVSQDLFAQSFTFDGDRITMSAFGINASGTYRIEGNQIRITYSLFGMEYDWTQSFSQSGNTVVIGGTEFIKQ